MTVEELIARLGELPPKAPARIYTDCCGCEGEVTGVALEDGAVVIENLSWHD